MGEVRNGHIDGKRESEGKFRSWNQVSSTATHLKLVPHYKTIIGP